MKKRRGGLVYSTESGRACAVCGWPKESCSCSAPGPARGGGKVRVGRETRGRAGKGVTVIAGLPLTGGELEELASVLKRRCGSGGTVKHGVVEIQGDHQDVLVAELVGRGFSVKRSGG